MFVCVVFSTLLHSFLSIRISCYCQLFLVCSILVEAIIQIQMFLEFANPFFLSGSGSHEACFQGHCNSECSYNESLLWSWFSMSWPSYHFSLWYCLWIHLHFLFISLYHHFRAVAKSCFYPLFAAPCIYESSEKICMLPYTVASSWFGKHNKRVLMWQLPANSCFYVLQKVRMFRLWRKLCIYLQFHHQSSAGMLNRRKW